MAAVPCHLPAAIDLLEDLLESGVKSLIEALDAKLVLLPDAPGPALEVGIDRPRACYAVDGVGEDTDDLAVADVHVPRVGQDVLLAHDEQLHLGRVGQIAGQGVDGLSDQ